jgi:uncharacterized membrane protein
MSPKTPQDGLHAEIINQNVDAVHAIYVREREKMTKAQRGLARVSGFLGQPRFLVSILLFAALWILGNLLGLKLGLGCLDAPPFYWLQGMVSLAALLTATVVLINQNRLAKLEEQRAHLDLQVNLFTEQKVTKLISLMEELRRDLPGVNHRLDLKASALEQPTDPTAVLAALNEP